MNERLSLKTKIQIALLSILSITLIGASLGFIINFVLTKYEQKMSSQKEIIASEQTVSNSSVPEEELEKEPPKPKEYTTGKYAVGIQMEEGIYKLCVTGKNPGFYRISKDASDESLSMSETDVFPSFTYVFLKEGQYFTLVDAKAFPIDEAPCATLVNGRYPSGQYLVGKDIPQDSYTVYPNKSFGYVEISDFVSSDNADILVSKYITGPYSITVSDGQFLKLSNAYILVE